MNIISHLHPNLFYIHDTYLPLSGSHSQRAQPIAAVSFLQLYADEIWAVGAFIPYRKLATRLDWIRRMAL
jgi:hypothetical protein